MLIVKKRAGDAYRRVLVAADFSEGCSRALGAAYEIAPSADVLAVHAWQLPAVGLGTRQAAEKAMNEENELLRRREEFCDEALEAGGAAGRLGQQTLESLVAASLDPAHLAAEDDPVGDLTSLRAQLARALAQVDETLERLGQRPEQR